LLVVRFITEDRLTNSLSLKFPGWVRPAVVEAANELSDQLTKERNPSKALEILSRLVSDPLMKRVWQEVYRKRRVRHQPLLRPLQEVSLGNAGRYLQVPSNEYLNFALTNASRAAALRRQASDIRNNGGENDGQGAELLEGEAAIIEDQFDPLIHPQWSKQDRAAQLLLWHAYRVALDYEPVYLSDLETKAKCLRKDVKDLLTGVQVLQSHDLINEATKLKKLADGIEDEADNTDPYIDPERSLQLTSPRFPHIDDPWVVVRETPDVQMRSFVISLSITTIQLFGKPLYRTLANITNAVFDREDVTDERVRELLRIRPTAEVV
jgi:hypothetical protein